MPYVIGGLVAMLVSIGLMVWSVRMEHPVVALVWLMHGFIGFTIGCLIVSYGEVILSVGE